MNAKLSLGVNGFLSDAVQQAVGEFAQDTMDGHWVWRATKKIDIMYSSVKCSHLAVSYYLLKYPH